MRVLGAAEAEPTVVCWQKYKYPETSRVTWQLSVGVTNASSAST